jgi:hypothetical protein
MADKPKKGKCYFCPKKFTHDHNCTSKGVFLMELEHDDELTLLVDKLGVSLHALMGLASTNMVQFLMQVTRILLHALVDSGSTHTFIHEAVIHRLVGLTIRLRPGLSIKVANGECL